MAELEESVRKLELKTDDAEDRLRNLQHTRLSLEKEQWAEIRQNVIGSAVKQGVPCSFFCCNGTFDSYEES